MGILVGEAGPQLECLPSPALDRGYWLLIGTSGSWGSWLWNPGAQGLVLDHWWAFALGPGVC